MAPEPTAGVRPLPPPLTPGTLSKVFLRSLFLQASWNPEGMQGLGLAYAIYPALVRIHDDPEQRRVALQRHLTHFNTHPYVAAAILGGAIHHERRISVGAEGPERVVAFKAALMGPFAALGDGFFWLSLKPAAGALCAALIPWLGPWAVVLFVALYNAIHLTARVRLFRLGLRLGDGVVEELQRANLPRWGRRLRRVAATCSGGLAGWLAVSFGRQEGVEWGGGLTLACLALGGAAYLAKRLPPALFIYLAAALAVAASILGPR